MNFEYAIAERARIQIKKCIFLLSFIFIFNICAGTSVAIEEGKVDKQVIDILESKDSVEVVIILDGFPTTQNPASSIAEAQV